jgi:hypothetical protein
MIIKSKATYDQMKDMTAANSAAPVRLYRVVCKSYCFNLSIQGSSISKMAGKSKSIMGTGEPEEIKKESGSLTEHWRNLKK